MRRSKFQKEKDLQITSELYLKGFYQSEIAEKLGVTQQQVSKDIKFLIKKWQKSAIEDINLAKNEELSKLNLLEKETWRSFDKSKEDKTKKRLKNASSGTGSPEKVLQTDSSNGDPRFLAILLDIIKERNKIKGTYRIVERSESPESPLSYENVIENIWKGRFEDD